MEFTSLDESISANNPGFVRIHFKILEQKNLYLDNDSIFLFKNLALYI